MKEITNRTIFTAMIIIGAIIALMIVPLYPNRSINLNGRNLGATAFFGNTDTNTYSPYLNTNYQVTGFRTSTTDTIKTTETIPGSTSYTTYNTYSYPETSTQTYYPDTNTNYGNYDAYGCKAGSNYSVTTGQPCYGYNSYNNQNYNYNNYNNNGGYYSNGVYVDSYGCGTGIIYSITTGQYCYNR